MMALLGTWAVVAALVIVIGLFITTAEQRWPSITDSDEDKADFFTELLLLFGLIIAWPLTMVGVILYYTVKGFLYMKNLLTSTVRFMKKKQIEAQKERKLLIEQKKIAKGAVSIPTQAPEGALSIDNHWKNE